MTPVIVFGHNRHLLCFILRSLLRVNKSTMHIIAQDHIASVQPLSTQYKSLTRFFTFSPIT